MDGGAQGKAEDTVLTCDVTSKGPNLIRGTISWGGEFGPSFTVGAGSGLRGSGVDIVEDGEGGKMGRGWSC